MDKLTDTELALRVELEQTRLHALKTQARALQAELQLAQFAGQEVSASLRGLMVEQEKRAADKKAAAEKPAEEVKPPEAAVAPE